MLVCKISFYDGSPLFTENEAFYTDYMNEVQLVIYCYLEASGMKAAVDNFAY
jgi:hypothetical protein